jgi:hypothetical protein
MIARRCRVFVSLPPEIHNMIFELLLADLDRISLIMLSLTCKKFKSIFDSFGQDETLKQNKIGLYPGCYIGRQNLQICWYNGWAQITNSIFARDNYLFEYKGLRKFTGWKSRDGVGMALG